MNIEISHTGFNQELKTEIFTNPKKNTVIKTCSEVTLTDCFVGIGIKTNSGEFGIAQRDNGIEIMLDGKIIFNIFKDKDNKIKYYSFGNASEILTDEVKCLTINHPKDLNGIC